MIVAAVSYLNAMPLIWGINQAAYLLHDSLVLAVPSKCAEMIMNRQADVALVPTAAIPIITNGEIITDFCISAEGEVDTVALLSNSNLKDIHTIYLDTDSRTSVELVRILALEKWKIMPQWLPGINRTISEGEAILAIGDKVFDIQTQYRYKWDLASEWIEHTSLPFVFAAWVAATPKGVEIASMLNQAMEYGVKNIEQAIADSNVKNKEQAYKYLTENIKYNLTQTKREAMQLFWEKRRMPG